MKKKKPKIFTVKAFALITNKGLFYQAHKTRGLLQLVRFKGMSDDYDEKIVPCTITYSLKAPKK